ncbi:ABC transporter ATP-binding protein/permease [Smaragdicoccus niigatensis]|uniref:ABC transporter ATP-binding protein/permease n=1 Tax=Smaragdicoccus niigatensis TaxID=359359 RepID=UPI00036C3CD9|nr:ATP-binding cassette domain-containing protein [Smaragdicoccus niigatensis]
MSTTTTRGPIDLGLVRESARTRRHIAATIALTTGSAVAIVAGAVCIGTVLAGVTTGEGFSPWALGGLAVAVLGDAMCTWLRERYGHRAADEIVTGLEMDVLASVAKRRGRPDDDLAHDAFVLVTRTLTDLRVYLGEYVPALGAALTVPPIVLAVIAYFDLTSAVIVVVTIPFVPLFMVLIGLLSKDRAVATLATLTRQSAEMLDVLEGLPTLRALGRERGLEKQLRRTGDRYRHTALGALRVAFLSSLVLEFIATLSVALVAVSIGLRLVFGDMPLAAGVIALILAPHVYGPIRSVGAKFHAAEDGVAALERARALLESEPVVTVPTNLTATIRAGQITALVGPNGSGKSTALLTMLGLVEPTSGNITIDGATDWQQVAWLPQHPAIVPGTLRENLRLSGLSSVDEQVLRACAATGFDDVLATLPDGWDTHIGVRGEGLSRGQQQRLALTRVLASPRSVLLLDEPTAHLDDAAEQRVISAIRERAHRGDTVVVVAHRPALIAAADSIVEVHAGE